MMLCTMLLAAVAPLIELTTADGKPVLKVDGATLAPSVCNAQVSVLPDGSIRFDKGAQLKFKLKEPIDLGCDFTTLVELRTRYMFPWTGQMGKDLQRRLDGTLATKSGEGSSCGIAQLFKGKDALVSTWACAGYVGMPGGDQMAWNRWVFPEEWHVFSGATSSNGAHVVGVRDGTILRSPFQGPTTKPLVFDTLSFGSHWGWDRNIEADIRSYKIWRENLDEHAQRKEQAKTHPVAVELHDYAFTEGRANRLRFRLFNFSDAPQKGVFSWRMGEDAAVSSKPPCRGEAAYDIAPGANVDLDFTVTPAKPGIFRLVTNLERSFETCTIAKESFVDRLPTGEPTFRLIDEIDCAADLPYPRAGLKESVVVRDATGAYRETPPVERGAYSYRIDNIRDPKRYHVLEIEYPDNSQRAFSVHVYSVDPLSGEVVGGQTHSVGILTGGFHLNTGKMQRKRLYFVPYSAKAMVIVENRCPQDRIRRPGAVAKLRVYEVGQKYLPKLPPCANTDREINVWDEDPSIDCVWFNNPSLERDVGLDFWREKAERFVEYANFVGYTAWTMQAIDYQGDRNGSFYTLPVSGSAGHSGHVNGWCDVYAKTYERDGLKFFCRLSPGYSGWQFWHDLAKGKADLRGQNCGVTGIDPTTPLAKELFCGIARHYRMKYADNPMFQGLEFDTRFFFKDGAENRDACTDLLKAFMAELRRGNDRLRVLLSIGWVQWQKGNATDDFDITRNFADIGCDLAAWRKIPGVVILPDQDPEGEQVWGFDMRWAPTGRAQQAIFDPAASAFFEKNLATRGCNFFLHANLENYPGTHHYLPESVYPMGYWGCKTNFPDFLSWCNPYPNDNEALQPWANILANMDAQHFLTGWWNTPDVGVTELFRKFYAAVRSIPNGDYRLVNAPDDPVAIRVSGENWYLVNRTQVPVTVKVEVEKEGGGEGGGGGGDGGGEWILGPSEVKVGKGARDWSKVRQTFDERILEDFREIEIVLTAEAVRGPDELKAKAAAFRTALEKKQLMRLRSIVCDPVVEKALKDVRGYRHTATFDPQTKSFDLAITSISRQPLELTVSWQGSEQWTIGIDRKLEKKVALDPGETKRVTMPLSKWEPDYQYEGAVLLKIAEARDKYRIYKYMVGGHPATKAKPGKRLGDDPKMRGYRRVHLDTQTAAGVVPWEYGYQWNEDGLFVCAVVQDEKHFPAKLTGDYNDMIHRNDSLQFFANAGAKAEWSEDEFDADDLEGLFGETVRGAELHVNRRPAGATGEVTHFFRRDGNMTSYEFFIPKTLLPGVRFQPGGLVGFRLMVNSRSSRGIGTASFDTTASGKVFPYKHPGTWPDIVFLP